MKSRINLYLSELRPVKERLPLTGVLLCWGGVLLIVVITSIVVNVMLSQQQQLNDQQQRRNDQRQQRITTLTTELSGRRQDPLLAGKLETLQAELDLKKRLLSVYSDREAENSQTFTALLEGLAATSRSQIWLTQITFNDGQLSLAGGASDAAAIPVWVEGLTQSQPLQGRSFAALTISRDEQQQWLFSLDSTLTPPDAQSVESDVPPKASLTTTAASLSEGGGE